MKRGKEKYERDNNGLYFTFFKMIYEYLGKNNKI